MGMINAGIESIAFERARALSKVEKINSEVTESVADELVEKALNALYMESEDDLDIPELEVLLDELPVDADAERKEILRVLACDDEDIDIDDIVGVSFNAE